MQANTQAPEYTDAQARFIASLAADRVTPVAGSTLVEAQIIARFEDILGNAPRGTDGHRYVSRREASAVIDWLKNLPRTAAPAPAAPAGGNDFSEMLTELRALPKSKYAVTGDAGQTVHVEVVERNHRVYLNLLIGHPGDWQRQRTSVRTARALIAKIMIATYDDAGRVLVGPEAAAVRFSREFTCCSVCMSPLSDAVSIARGLGPICAGRF